MQIAKITYITALLGLGAFCPAPALSMQSDPIERCRQADTDQERIACLEAALRAPRQEPETPEVAEAAKEPAPSVPPPPVDTPRPQPPEIADMGAEQVSARNAPARGDEPAPRLHATIRRIEIVPYRRLQVTLENGHVWRQIRGDNQRINVRIADNQTVEIWQSNLGGYRMRLNESARTIGVERIR